MNILIPCAGQGRRFQECGYTKPKPFISAYGMPMIMRVLHNLDICVDERVILLFQQSVIDSNKEDIENIIKYFPMTVVVPVDKPTEGAACTALLAKDHINCDYPLWITDCDHIIVDENHTLNADIYFEEHESDGGPLCHISDDPKWSYCRLSGNRVVEIVEKQVISNLANTGDYFFQKGSDFVRCAEKMISKNDRAKGEFYIAPVYNYMISEGKKILPYMVNNMIGFGTPEDLNKYENLCSKFK